MRNSLKFLAKQTKLEFDVNCRYYNLLDVNPDATVQAIRSAYYRLAKKFHPDAFYVKRTADADQQFAKITEAYEVLSDSTLRQDYDRFLSKTDKPKPTSEPEVASKIAFLLSNDLLSEVSKIAKSIPKIEKAIGGAVTQNMKVKFIPKVEQVKPDIDSTVEIQVPFMQAISEQIHHASLRFSSHCPSCSKSNRRGCTVCHGSGHIPVEKVVPIRIPGAVNNGEILTIKHPVDPKESLKIRVKVEKHSHFVRDKLDIVTTTKIPWLIGLLGGDITVKTVYGEIVPVSIRPGTDSHTTIRLAGKGVKSAEGSGDHIVVVKIIMPEKLSQQQKKILLQFF